MRTGKGRNGEEREGRLMSPHGIQLGKGWRGGGRVGMARGELGWSGEDV